jgi:hypothetical protein
VAEITMHLLNKNIYNERFIINADSIAYKELFVKIAQAFRKRPPWIRVHPELVKLTILLDKGISWLLRKEPMLENDLSEVVRNKHVYDNSKIRNLVDFNFRNIDDTINWSCDTLLKKIEI